MLIFEILHNLKTYDIKGLIKTKQVINKDFSIRYSIAVLARIAGMSITKFKTSFKLYFGYNPFEYAQLQRMKKAKKLVIENYLSIKCIASICGYVHTSHFHTAFKKAHGISVKKMRQQTAHSKKMSDRV